MSEDFPVPTIEVRPIRAFKDNYIWVVLHHQLKEIIVIDPGDAGPVLDEFKTLKEYKLAALLITHKHNDHIGGVLRLLEQARVPVFGSATEHIPDIVNSFVAEGTLINLPGWPSIKVIAVPGHTLGHVAYLMEDKLFCGDTLFGAGCGRLFEGTIAQLFNSLNKLKALPDETLVYCAHEYTLHNLNFAMLVEPGNEKIAERKKLTETLYQSELPSLPSTIAMEKATNPFFRCDQVAVKKKAEEYAQLPLTQEIEVFEHIRAWRNQF